MILSCIVLQKSIAKYKKSRKTKEMYINGEKENDDSNVPLSIFILIISIMFFLIEIMLLFYAINIAVECSQTGSERIVNLVLAITWTIPYLMLNTLFNECAKNVLRNNNAHNLYKTEYNGSEVGSLI